MSSREYLDSITNHICPRCGGQGKLLVNEEKLIAKYDEEDALGLDEEDKLNWDEADYLEPERDKEGNLQYGCINRGCGVIFAIDDHDHVRYIRPPLEMDVYFSVNGRVIKKSVRWSEEEGAKVTIKYFGDSLDDQDEEIDLSTIDPLAIDRIVLVTDQGTLVATQEVDESEEDFNEAPDDQEEDDQEEG